MDLQATTIDIGTHTPTVVLDGADAAELGVHSLDRAVAFARANELVRVGEPNEALVERYGR